MAKMTHFLQLVGLNTKTRLLLLDDKSKTFELRL